jgi:hypothetical protein
MHASRESNESLVDAASSTSNVKKDLGVSILRQVSPTPIIRGQVHAWAIVQSAKMRRPAIRSAQQAAQQAGQQLDGQLISRANPAPRDLHIQSSHQYVVAE